MDLVVRYAEIKDYDSIIKIDHIAVKEESRKNLIKDALLKDEVSVVLCGSSITGYSITLPNFFGFPFIEMLYIDEKYRGKGLGNFLLQAITKNVQYEKIFTSTNQSNAQMKKLLLKQNWIRSGIIENLDNNDPELVYCKFLK